MRVVSRFEANLLHVLHFFLRRVPREQALPLVLNPSQPPRCLSRAAIELVQQALARGCVQLLARSDGWRSERYLRGERAARGRLWQRTPPQELALTFSGNTLRFLIWVTASAPEQAKDSWEVREQELTPGDLLLLFLAYEVLHDTPVGPALACRRPFKCHGLCWLAYPGELAAVRTAKPDFAPWTAGVGACILEGLQSRLARRWLEEEQAKRTVHSWQVMQRLGAAQERTLAAFLDAVDAAGRRDLGRFLLRTAVNLLGEGAGLAQWVGGLTSAGPRLADRSATHAAALAFLRQLERFRRWETEARAVGYFDEGYAAAQFWKAEMEHWQFPALLVRAQEIVRQASSFRSN